MRFLALPAGTAMLLLAGVAVLVIGLYSLKEIENLRRLVFSPTRRQHLAQTIGKSDQIHPIMVQQGHVCQRRCDALGIVVRIGRDRRHDRLRRREPQGEMPGVVLHQYAEEAFH